MLSRELESRQQSSPSEQVLNRPERQLPRRRHVSLSVRVSFWLVVAAILPLLITVVFSELQSRPTLTAQANTAMENNAKTRVQLIDTYFSERLLDAQTLTQVPSVQQFLAVPPAPESPTYQTLSTHASYSLVAGMYRDKRYTTWQIFDADGKLRLYYPVNNTPKPHGSNLVPPEDLQSVRSGKTFISQVYYSPETQKASVDIYSPIYMQPEDGQTGQKPTLLGFMRATLNLDYVWNIVSEDLGSNGNGSYAFILDENGVRIADTDPRRLFTAVAPLPTATLDRIHRDARYGSSNADVTVIADAKMAEQLKSNASFNNFQTQPANQTELFQVVQHATSVVHWKYIVLSPVNTVTAIANQQLWVTSIVALSMSLLIAIIGLIVGRGITRPILSSVDYLQNNSQALSSLATRQQDAASEQMWVVDSSQVGLESIQYYTEAIKFAALQLNDLGKGLVQHWNTIDTRLIRQALERIIAAAHYIEQASNYQNTSNEKLATALKVATQVTEQLMAGATSATDAAAQLEEVVAQLRSVVGK